MGRSWSRILEGVGFGRFVHKVVVTVEVALIKQLILNVVGPHIAFVFLHPVHLFLAVADFGFVVFARHHLIQKIQHFAFGDHQVEHSGCLFVGHSDELACCFGHNVGGQIGAVAQLDEVHRQAEPAVFLHRAEGVLVDADEDALAFGVGEDALAVVEGRRDEGCELVENEFAVQ